MSTMNQDVPLSYPPPGIGSTSTSSASSSPLADCALVEIIHLHDCLRGALHHLLSDVNHLVQASDCLPDDATQESCQVDEGDSTTAATASAAAVASTAGSLAPTHKIEAVHSTCSSDSSEAPNRSSTNTEKVFHIKEAADTSNLIASRFYLIWSVFQAHSNAEDEFIWPTLKAKVVVELSNCGCGSSLGQAEYEEDHAVEENMFKQISITLRRLNASFRLYHASEGEGKNVALCIIKKPIQVLKEQVEQLTEHLKKHLEKEETQCLPMVQKHLTKEEIAMLVGKIMGKRSAEVMTKILNLAVHSLPDEERFM